MSYQATTYRRRILQLQRNEKPAHDPHDLHGDGFKAGIATAAEIAHLADMKIDDLSRRLEAFQLWLENNDDTPSPPEDGGPADGGHPGMSLRDWLAGQAVNGLLSHPDCGAVGPGYESTTRCAAAEAYAIADAMLEARKK